MRDIFSVDFRDAIRKITRRELKEKFGVKTIKDKDKNLKDGDYDVFKVFGVPLDKVPSKSLSNEDYFAVPVFLKDAFDFLTHHLKVEGLFRKSGSVGRQKMLKEVLEKEGTCCSCDFAQAHDVAALVKQFFRELPDPLLTTRLTPVFIKCVSLTSNSDAISALALCTLLLPDEHLRVLKYFTKFVNEVANHSLESKMTLSNLAIVFAPNLMSTVGKDKTSEKSMKEMTHVVNLLFKNFHLIGMVPDILFEKARNINNDGGFCSSSGDELETDFGNDRYGRTLARSDKRRDRSKSIKGFLKRNFKNEPNKMHARTRSERLSPQAKGGSIKRQSSADNIPKPEETKDCHLKRRNSSKTNISPVRKSPRLAEKEQQFYPVISKPALLTLPTQVALTPRRYLQPIQNITGSKESDEPKKGGRERMRALPVITKIYDHQEMKTENDSKKVKSKVNLYRSKSDYVSQKSSSSSSLSNANHSKSSLQSLHSNSSILDDSSTSTVLYRESLCPDADGKLPQPKISRTTQKPHVRKTRRASSMDRRRARYNTSQPPVRRLPKTPVESKLEAKVADWTRRNETIGINQGFVDDEITDEPLMTGGKVNNQTTQEFHQPENPKPPPRSRVRRQKSKSNRHLKNIPSLEQINESANKETTRDFIGMDVFRRSSTIDRKPPTPYSVTPQVGARRTGAVIGNL